MKIKAHVRVARPPKGKNGKPKIVVTSKPNHAPLGSESAWWPTVYFAMELEVPDSAFDKAETVVAMLNVRDPVIAADLKEVPE